MYSRGHFSLNLKTMSEDKPAYVAFFGVMGATSAMVFSGEEGGFLRFFSALPLCKRMI